MKWFEKLSYGGKLYVVCTAVYFLMALGFFLVLFGIKKELKRSNRIWYNILQELRSEEIDTDSDVGQRYNPERTQGTMGASGGRIMDWPVDDLRLPLHSKSFSPKSSYAFRDRDYSL